MTSDLPKPDQPEPDLSELVARFGRLSQETELAPDTHVRVPRVTPGTAEDARVLAAAGFPYDAVHRYTHDDAVAALHAAGRGWDVPSAADVWVAGLWSAPWWWRTALTGHLLASTLPAHEAVRYGGSDSCRICGTRTAGAVATTGHLLSSLTNGAPIDGAVPEHALGLDHLAGQPRPVPTEHDRWTLRAVLTVLRGMPDGKRYSAARSELKRHRLLDATPPYAYGAVLEELGLVGVLATEAHPGLVTRWSDFVERDQRPSVRVEVPGPLAWWTSAEGLREDVVRTVFAAFDTADVDLDGPRPDPEPARGATVPGAVKARSRALAAAARRATAPATTAGRPRAIGP
ncbi:hypothetical protein [Cellulomonas sp. URHB0016]